MFNLTKEERIAIIFLLISLLLGLGLSLFNTLHNKPHIKIIHSDTSQQSEPSQININEASISELMELKGIGPKLAKAIIEYRERNGQFIVKEDLMKVKGIGKAKFESLKGKITLE